MHRTRYKLKNLHTAGSSSHIPFTLYSTVRVIRTSSHKQKRHKEIIKGMIPGGKPAADSNPLSLARFKICLKLFSRPFGRGCGSCCRSKLSNQALFIAGDAFTSENGCLLALGGLPLLFTSTLPIVRTCEANSQTPIPPPSHSIIPPPTT